jgi:hypothetical protein
LNAALTQCSHALLELQPALEAVQHAVRERTSATKRRGE